MTVLDTSREPASADTPASALEIAFLRPLLQCLPPERKFALDVGAHKGDITEALADLGFRVLAVEPQDYMADRFARRHAERMNAGTIRLARCAVSDRAGEADLIIGSASTVSTLEPLWTSVAFPEEFRTRRSVRVPLRPLADLLAEEEDGPVGFAKIDVEGHELPAMRGLLAPGVAPPLAIMFEACQRFAPQVVDCLTFLHSQGYHTFDIFVRIGLDLVAAERFTGCQLPQAWNATGGRFFYANLVGYHQSLPEGVPLPDLSSFLRDYRLATGQDVIELPSITSPSTTTDTSTPAPEWFAEDFARFLELSLRHDRGLPLRWEQRQPCLDDRTPKLGFDRHYIYHTAWAARMLAQIKPARHVDISSTLYFGAIASAFVPVDYFEYRPVHLALDNLTTGTADLQHLPFADQSVQSISCMHVVEHIGLGRYGDSIDPDGDLRAIAELIRVLAPGGSLLFVVPVGRPRIVFNGHRIYALAQVREYFSTLELVEFSLIPDGRHDMGLLPNPPEEFVNAQNYGCGCFQFRRNPS